MSDSRSHTDSLQRPATGRPAAADSLTSGRRLARNVLWNLLGALAPFLVAVFVIPVLIEGLGVPRFGLLAFAWLVVGYFSLFDFGLGRALTKLVAEKLGAGLAEEVAPLVWTGMLLMIGLGIVGGLLAAALTPWIVGGLLEISADLHDEAERSFYLLSAAIPVVIASAGLRGVLEAHQLFRLVNLVQIPLGLLTFLGPAAVLPFSTTLVPVVAVLVASRLAAAIAFAAICVCIEPALRRGLRIKYSNVRPLLRLGGWMTVSNIVSPLLVYMDRFLIGAVISMTAVAYYATPYEVVTKLLVVPVALMGVMFPAFSAVLVNDRSRAADLFERAIRYVFLLLFPAVLIILTLASEGLELWLSPEFAANSAVVLQLLAIGVFMNGHAQVAFWLVQGAGRPDLTAKLHVLELLIYVPILWLLLDAYGIAGAAAAWAARMAVDALCLFLAARRLLPETSRITLRLPISIAVVFAAFGLGTVLSGLAIKAAYLMLILGMFAAATWRTLLDPDERAIVRARLDWKRAR